MVFILFYVFCVFCVFGVFYVFCVFYVFYVFSFYVRLQNDLTSVRAPSAASLAYAAAVFADVFAAPRLLFYSRRFLCWLPRAALRLPRKHYPRDYLHCNKQPHLPPPPADRPVWSQHNSIQ